MKRYEVLIVGAGPAGLSAAITAAKAGMRTAVFDENARPGGQLFKQIHKFFGSREHKAKIRGYRIGTELLSEAEALGVEVHLNTVVTGIFEGKEINVIENGVTCHYKGNSIIVAAGARENMIPFEGWTLPGVIGAGAAQTMMNLHGVKPGSRVLMVGSGNVGLVVSYQLLQAGIEVAAIIDAAPRVGGYGVHAAKVARTGVPFLLSHTIIKAEGRDRVTGAVVAAVDERFQPIPGTEIHYDVDTVCMAVGLSPMNQLLSMAGCRMEERKGTVPVLNEYGETSVEGIFAAGDVAGIEEASSAMLTGRIAGASAARKLGFLEEEKFQQEICSLKASLARLHEGMFSPENRGRNDLTETDEGILLSQSLLKHGYVAEDEITRFPGAVKKQGIHPVIECTQNIPCDPCQDACKFGCIAVGSQITRLPAVVKESTCTGCGLCVASCSGQAIFLVNEDYDETGASITMPYEFLPYPEAGEKGIALGRDGAPVCEAEVVSLKVSPVMDKTALLTIRVPKEMAMKARFYKKSENIKGGAGR